MYVDGFVIPLPKKNLSAYQKMAKMACKVWCEYGALAYHECSGDDLKIEGVLSFLTMAQCKPSETVIFAWIAFKSRAHRDRVNAKVMKDPRLSAFMDGKAMPFDVKRMAYGGFKALVSA